MGFLSASGGFTRYKIVEDVSDDLVRDIPARLGRNAFKDIDNTVDERSFGWVCFDDFLDNSWRVAPPQKANYLAFSLRLDTRRISPAVFKKHLRMALDDEKASLREVGKTFITKDRKEEIKDRVKLSLMSRALPVPAVFDAVWNLENHTILLCSNNSKVKELFEDHFTLSFELNLEQQAPVYLGLRLAPEDRRFAFENLEPSQFAGDL